MIPPLMREVGEISRALKDRTGYIVGVACRGGMFAVSDTRKEGRRNVTRYLTPWQSYRECAEAMRAML